jgi:hypothetical protein
MSEIIWKFFWDLARIIKSKTTIALNNNKPLTVLHEDVPRWATGERNKGKSQTVFLLSNVDQVATLEPKTAKNFQIENFQKKTSCDKLVSVISKFIDTGHVTTAIPG